MKPKTAKILNVILDIINCLLTYTLVKFTLKDIFKNKR